MEHPSSLNLFVPVQFTGGVPAAAKEHTAAGL